jgi:hypothetical protein
MNLGRDRTADKSACYVSEARLRGLLNQVVLEGEAGRRAACAYV